MYAGGLYKNYGIWTLIDATCSVLESCPDFQLVLVGRGPEESALRSRIAEKNLQGRIKILGYVSQGDLDRLMLSAEALIAPLNNTVADRARCPSKIPMYMMAGKPIITCNIGEAWEYLKDAGVYYTPEDPKSLATSFARIWSVPTQFPSMEAEVVSWESLSSRYLDFWRGAAQ
jgi:glycosyltransferase involved in cell wall biosynthesis